MRCSPASRIAARPITSAGSHPEQYGSRFGLSQGDINKVAGWLEGEGLQVDSIPASQNAIVARGSAQQVAAALHTEIHQYVVNGKAQFANSSSPSVPAALAEVIAGIGGYIISR